MINVFYYLPKLGPMENTKQEVIPNKKVRSPQPLIYQKPKVILLDFQNIQGGSQSIPESNSGIIS